MHSRSAVPLAALIGGTGADTVPPMRPSEPYERWSRRTDGPLLVLALAFLAVFLAPMYDPTLPAGLETSLRVASGLLWLLFAVDYAVRLRLAPDRGKHVRTHIPDLLAVALPLLRPLRVLRLIGILGSATRRAGRHAQARVTGALISVIVLIMVTAAGLVLDAERGAKGANISTPGDALWWAMTTVSTVGYGDRFPVTTQGRVAASALMLTGIALVGIVTASVAAWFVKTFARQDDDAASLREIADRLQRLEALVTRGGS